MSRAVIRLVLTWGWLLGMATAERSLLEETLSVQTKSVETEISEEGVLHVSIAPGPEGYPSLRWQPETKNTTWDLSAYKEVAVSLRNAGTQAVTVHLRVDNPGHWKEQPWRVEKRRLVPQEVGTLVTQWKSPSEKPFDPARVTGIVMFTGKVQDEPVRLELQQLVARAAVPNVAFPITLTFPASDGESIRRINLPEAPLDFRKTFGLEVQMKGGGGGVRPSIRVRSGPDEHTDWSEEGTASSIRIPFASKNPWRAEESDLDPRGVEQVRGTGTRFRNDHVLALEMRMPARSSEVTCTIEAVHPSREDRGLPDWLGARPPVEGDWALTFDDEFEGRVLDASKWTVKGPNYWGAKHLTHWSAENVFLRDGRAVIRLEKKRGRHNDEPDGHVSDYQGGYLDTYDRWRQRYGYFEARMKLPTASGLWPAFWLMPDHGREQGPQWKRQQTERGAMEFDIMEYLTRWGPCRYHVAWHWDGYGKRHKSMGTTGVYFAPDHDGMVTSGLLWLPGEAVYYCQGREVARLTGAQVSNAPAMMMVTMPIGGWDNAPLRDEELPGELEIDWVRVWQRADLAREGDGFYP
ncbi:MAG: glycoside hydrolase family 16 protein [Verrucomicrobiota bacterium]